MLHIDTFVRQLTAEEFSFAEKQLSSGKAHKFLQLLHFYRSGALNEGKLMQTLGLNQNAFYVLKSRLFQKLQGLLIEFMSQVPKGRPNQSLLIPQVVFEMPRAKAMAILTKLERDYLEMDLPRELISIYSTLRRLHQHTDKYYHYDQLYNKHVAYSLALDKAEELLARLVAELAGYMASRDPQFLTSIPLLKEELNNHHRLYQSHHLQVFKNLAEINVALNIPEKGFSKDDQPVEDNLREIEDIIVKYPKDLQYSYLQKVIPLLWFEYYSQLGLHKKADQYLSDVAALKNDLWGYRSFAFVSNTLLTELKHRQTKGDADQLAAENTLVPWDEPDLFDLPNYCNWIKYMVVCEWLAGNVSRATQLCHKLLNSVSLKNHPHFELEVRLLLAMCYIHDSRFELAWNLLRAIS